MPQNKLSKRELEIAQLAGKGLTSQSIANELYISRRTVDFHMTNIYKKLGVSGKMELANVL